MELKMSEAAERASQFFLRTTHTGPTIHDGAQTEWHVSELDLKIKWNKDGKIVRVSANLLGVSTDLRRHDCTAGTVRASGKVTHDPA